VKHDNITDVATYMRLCAAPHNLIYLQYAKPLSGVGSVARPMPTRARRVAPHAKHSNLARFSDTDPIRAHGLSILLNDFDRRDDGEQTEDQEQKVL
jgi:hypothetical protein